jgi:uncharacterized membrane protein YozB (DUF420 family)
MNALLASLAVTLALLTLIIAGTAENDLRAEHAAIGRLIASSQLQLPGCGL